MQRRSVAHRESQRAIRRRACSARAGHSPTPRGHQAKASCSWSGVTSAPVGQPGLADEHHQPVGQRQQRLGLDAGGRDRPLLAQLPHQRVGGVLAEVDRAARAERPAPGPGGQPRRAPPRQPAPVGRAGDAQRGHRCRRRRRPPAAAPSAAAAARARGPRRARGSRPAAPPSRRGWVSPAPAARRSRRRPPRRAPAWARTAPRSSARPDPLERPGAARENHRRSGVGARSR